MSSSNQRGYLPGKLERREFHWSHHQDRGAQGGTFKEGGAALLRILVD